MRVTSAPVSASSLAASAASRALYEPVRIEPAKTRIFGTGMTPIIHRPSGAPKMIRAGSRPGRHDIPSYENRQQELSVLAIDPHPRRRQILPDQFGGMCRHLGTL